MKWHAGQTEKKTQIHIHRQSQEGKGISFRKPTDLINMTRQAGQTEKIEGYIFMTTHRMGISFEKL